MANTMTETEANDVVTPAVSDLEEKHQRLRDEIAHGLVSSDRVEGTRVFRPNGERAGKVHHFMVGKRSGRVEYVVLSFGGFLGMGDERRPVPWGALCYDEEMGGYVIAADDEKLRNSPLYDAAQEPRWDRDYASYVYGYWGFAI